MQFIQTKGTLKNGVLFLEKELDELSTEEQDVDVIIFFKEPQEQAEFDQIRTEMQIGFQEAGIETREQVLQLIKEVKLELFQERQKCKESF
ncbi:MAG: hypothetical protein EBE86_000520 [Hormoscilla sp. GUM202]|nr:hypothetical protein [Hormoscilla sp. GUM202]